MSNQSDDQLSEQETAKRMEAALKRALNTPHKKRPLPAERKPQKPSKAAK